MSYMSDSPLPDQFGQLVDERARDGRSEPRNEIPKPTAVKSFRLRRPGTRPIVFNGVELGMAMSFNPELPYWYEINLYRTVGHSFVLAIKTFFQGENEKDLMNAWTFASLSEAIDALEAYDPAQEIRVAINVEDPALTVPDLAASAMELRARAEAARRHFSSLVGEFLFQIDQVV